MAFLALPANAATEETWVINAEDTEIKEFIIQVSEVIEKNFVIDPNVKGKVTVVSKASLNKKGVEELLLSVLQVHGYRIAYESEQLLRIVPQTAILENTATGDVAGATVGGKVITRVLPLRHLKAADAVKELRPLVARDGYLEASTYANALIISDRAANIEHLMDLIDTLDLSENDEMEIVTLKESSVKDISGLLERLLPGRDDAGKKQYQNIRVVASERTNSLILKGDASERARVRRLVEELDKPAGASSSVQVKYLRYADATDLAKLLAEMLASKDPASADSVSIQANESLNALVVRADPGRMKEIDSVVSKLDIRRAQVLIEAAIVEITGELDETLGIQFGGGDAAFEHSQGATSFTQAGASLGTLLASLNAPGRALVGSGLTVSLGKTDKFSAILQALSATTNTNLLSTPSITTLDNQEAKILVGQSVPFLTGTFTNDGGDDNPFTTIQREDVGITLKVVPHIHEGDAVRLDIQQEVSSVLETNITGAADLVTNKRTINTAVLADNGETIVLGGLIQDDITKNKSKVPFLGDIPVVGLLFSSTSDEYVKKNLLVFLRPTILRNREEVKALSENRYKGIWELNLSEEEREKGEPISGSLDQIYDNSLPWLRSRKEERLKW